MLQHPFYWLCQYGLKATRNNEKKLLVRSGRLVEQAPQSVQLVVIQVQPTACACSNS